MNVKDMATDQDDADGPDLSIFSFGDDEEEEGGGSGPTASLKAPETTAAVQKRHRQEEQRLRTEAKAKLRDIPKGDRAAKQAAEDELERALEEM